MTRTPRLLLLSLSLSLLAACASTQLTNVWSDPSIGTSKLTSVMGLVISKDEVTRRTGEDALVAALAPTKAVASYRIMKDEELRDQERSKQALLALGVDGVVTMRLVGSEQQTTYLPGTYPGFWGYYRWAAPMVYSPGYLTTDTIVRVETKVYALKGDRLVWAGVSDTFNPGSARTLVDDVAREVVTDLRRRGVVQ